MQELKRIGTIADCPVVALERDGKILMGYRHYKSDKWKEISVWTVPGGRCDEGEALETTLRRETAEETGIKDFEILSFAGTVPGAKEGDIVWLFIGKTSEDATLMEPEKFSEWKWQPLDAVPENFINAKLLALIRKSFGR